MKTHRCGLSRAMGTRGDRRARHAGVEIRGRAGALVRARLDVIGRVAAGDLGVEVAYVLEDAGDEGCIAARHARMRARRSGAEALRLVSVSPGAAALPVLPAVYQDLLVRALPALGGPTCATCSACWESA